MCGAKQRDRGRSRDTKEKRPNLPSSSALPYILRLSVKSSSALSILLRAASRRLISSMPSIECVDVVDVVWVDVEDDDRGTSGIDGAMRGRARQCVNDGASRRRSWFVACARA